MRTSVVVLLVLSLATPLSGCAPDDFTGHWILHDSTVGPDGTIEALTHLYLRSDGSTEIGIELDGLPVRTILVGVWSQPSDDEFEVRLNNSTDVMVQRARLSGDVLTIQDESGNWTSWVRGLE